VDAMQRGIIPINKQFELEYRYYDRDTSYKYFNRKFEIYLLEKKGIKKNYILHMDNCDTTPGKWSPHIHKAPSANKKLYFGVTTLNWSDIKNSFFDCVVSEIGDSNTEDIKKAVGKLLTPKL
jgi:hypothetical protein